MHVSELVAGSFVDGVIAVLGTLVQLLAPGPPAGAPLSLRPGQDVPAIQAALDRALPPGSSEATIRDAMKRQGAMFDGERRDPTTHGRLLDYRYQEPGFLVVRIWLFHFALDGQNRLARGLVETGMLGP